MPNEHAILEPHRKKKLRAILKGDDRSPEVGALWAVLYGYAVVDHATAQHVAHECTTSDRTVGDVLDGWRPVALGPKP